MPPPVHLGRLTDHSFQAWQDGYPVFTVRETTEGWKTEGHPAHDGLLFTTKDELIDHLEGRTR
jgi:hypothetical protein